tara:strand:- start:78 stop:314 length:237 start_codon:yes stop_codon:yes gene_type:complete
MPKQKGRSGRVKAITKALGGGKNAQRSANQGQKAVRKGIKAIGGKKQARKGAVRAGASALKNLGKTSAGREQRKKFFG